MDPERWKKIEQLYHAALEREESQRSDFLKEVCGTDESLRKKVEALLAQDEGVPEFIETPALEVAAQDLAQSQRLKEGQKIGSYQVLSLLGVGGMGEVYLAQDTSLDRQVAVKVLPPELEEDEIARKRFLREAKSAAAIDHPFVCSIYEVNSSAGQDFIAMEYVQGQTLQEKLQMGPLPLKEALGTALEIAEALEVAHQRNIAHRDLKPSNIMLTAGSHVKVMDFGLAKRVTQPGGSGRQDQSLTADLTKTGTTIGTPAYMSPEQLRGEDVDTRSDIFSFGVLLYESLTGFHPFGKTGLMETASSILKDDPPPLSSHIGSVSPLLQHTVKKMLAKDPDRRYQLIHEVKTDLGDLIDELAGSPMTQAGRDSSTTAVGEINTPVLTRSWKHAALWSISAAVIILAGASVWNWRGPAPAPLPVTRVSITPGTNPPLKDNDGIELAISPDGRKIVFQVGFGGETEALFLRDLDRPDAEALPGTEGAEHPFFSPDGRFLAFFAPFVDGQLVKLSLLGGTAVPICDFSGYAGGGSWGSDGTIVFLSDQGKALYRVPANGGEPELLLTPEKDEGESYGLPRFLPGNEALLLDVWDEAQGAQVILFSPETGDKKILIEGGGHPHYTSTGHLVYEQVFAWTLMAVPFDLEKHEVTGQPVVVLEGIRGREPGWADWTLSNTGTLAYVPRIDDRSNPVWVDREGREEPLPLEPRSYRQLQLSPDGSRVALHIADPGNEDIWIYELAFNTLTRLTSDLAVDDYPVWTPDGQRVVFSSFRNTGKRNLFWKSANGTGEVDLLLARQEQLYSHFFSPDGKKLVFDSERNLQVLSMEDQQSVEPLSQGSLVRPSRRSQPPVLSPDGRWLAYRSDETGQVEVYVRPFPNLQDRKWQISRTGGEAPRWSPDGSELLYRDGEAVMVAVIQTKPTFSAGRPRVLFTGRYLDGAQTYGIPADGQRLLMLKPVARASEPAKINVVLNWFEELKRLVPTDSP